MKKLIVFDLDGTLAPSKSLVDAETLALLHDLLGIVKVAVISGGAWAQFEKQVLSNLPHDDRLANLSLLPTCGTKFFQYVGDWKELYSEDFSPEEKEKIVSSLKKAVEMAGFSVEKTWGQTVIGLSLIVSIAITLVAALPAITRALRVDPSTILRSE